MINAHLFMAVCIESTKNAGSEIDGPQKQGLKMMDLETDEPNRIA
jgi:hypothetical protein